MENAGKLKSFTDLLVWQEGHKLVILIYKITGVFPTNEIYALTSQMRRAAVSVTSNIAEGFSRISKKEKAQFYYMALGSLEELRNQVFIARDVHYINSTNEILLLIEKVSKLLNGLVRSTRA